VAALQQQTRSPVASQQIHNNMLVGKGKTSDAFESGLVMQKGLVGRAKPEGYWRITCVDKDGNVKWVEDYQNVITEAGQDYLLDVGLSNGTQISTWYVGLTDDSPTIAEADTMSSHSGWVEAVPYSDANRITWSDGGVSSQSVDNSASTADFTINATDTVGGAFLVSNNTKSGTTGTLYAVGAFSSNRAVESGDTLKVTATFTMADDGA